MPSTNIAGPVNLKDIVETFVQSVQHPEAPQHCISAYLQILLKLDYNAPHVFQHLRRTFPSLFSAAIRFLTYPRSTSQLSNLERRISVCSCTDGRHGHLDLSPFKAVGMLMGTLARLLHYCFVDYAHGRKFLCLDDVRKEAKKAAKRGEHVLWPARSSDVFANAPEDIIEMLWKLYCRYKETFIINFLHIVVAATGTTLTSRFHTLRSMPTEFLIAFDELLCVPSEWSQGQAVSFQSLSFLFCLILQRFYDQDVALIACWTGLGHDALTLVTRAIARLSFPAPVADDSSTTITALSRCGEILLNVFGAKDPFVTSNMHRYTPALVQTYKAHRTIRATPCLLAYDRSRRFAQSDRCHAPGCAETFSKQNRTFQACGGCSIMSYCSKDCQTRAWKHPSIPHKPLCRAFAAFAGKFKHNWRKDALAPTGTFADAIEHQCRDAGVTVDEAKELLRWEAEWTRWHVIFDGSGEVMDPRMFRYLMDEVNSRS